ncbi:unnamed protein product [Euphydryas editha]|uniref:Uncharacterized protein n=1 Tax=Euphydryas editha TaxID=104508 RepID=A0AAU9TZ69_EUPED|nr:unnamed protein product [Euphydryas editha]
MQALKCFKKLRNNHIFFYIWYLFLNSKITGTAGTRRGGRGRGVSVDRPQPPRAARHSPRRSALKGVTSRLAPIPYLHDNYNIAITAERGAADADGARPRGRAGRSVKAGSGARPRQLVNIMSI